jgi:hypothetical protein
VAGKNYVKLKKVKSGCCHHFLGFIYILLQVPELIPLPDDYSELINSVSGFTCPRALGTYTVKKG